MLEPAHGIGQLGLAHAVHLGAKGSQDRYRCQPGEPFPILLDLWRDHRLRCRKLLLAPLDVRRRNGAQVIEIVQEDVAELPNAWIDIARHRNVEDAEWTIAARLERANDLFDTNDRVGCRGRADKQIDVGEMRPAFIVMQRLRLVALRELLCALVRAIRDDRRPHALAHQALECELRHVAGAEHHRVAPAERAEDLGRELHRRGAGGRGASPDRRLVAHATAHHERRLEEAAQHRARGAAAALPRVSHLAVNLRLAEDHRVDARGHAIEMRYRLAVAAHVSIRRDVFAKKRGEVVPDRGDGIVVARVKFGAIARGEENDLLGPRRLEDALRGDDRVTGADDEALAQRERRRVMTHAGDDQRHR